MQFCHRCTFFHKNTQKYKGNARGQTSNYYLTYNNVLSHTFVHHPFKAFNEFCCNGILAKFITPILHPIP